MENLTKEHSIVKSILFHTKGSFLPLYNDLKDKYNLSLPEAYTYCLWFNRYRLSMAYGKHGKNGKCFFDGQNFYIATKYDKFRNNSWLPNSNDAINKIINNLTNAKLIIKTNKEHYMQVRIPKWENIIEYGITVPTKSTDSEKRKPSSPKNREKYKGYLNNPRSNSTGNTFNTVNGRKATKSESFKKLDPLSDWVDSAKYAGLSLSSANCIARFCSKNFKYKPEDHCRRIYKIIDNARGHEIKQAHKEHKRLTKDLIYFESNGKVISGLAPKLRKVFTKVINSNSNKLTINHYDKYLMTSLKNFFYDALGLKEQKILTPTNKIIHENNNNNSYGNRKPIKEDIPQSMKDDQSGKSKAKKTDKLLTNLIQARNAYDQAVEDNIDSDNPDTDKINTLRERVKHYEKLYDAKQQSTKPTPKSKEHKQSKQPKKLKKTSKALHDEIQARLARLGEK